MDRVALLTLHSNNTFVIESASYDAAYARHERTSLSSSVLGGFFFGDITRRGKITVTVRDTVVKIEIVARKTS